MCTIRFKREKRYGYSLKKIRVFVDGELSSSVENGGVYQMPLAPGKHEISFFIGKTLLSDVMVSIDGDTEPFDIIFWITGAGEIEAKLTNYNIEHSINQRKNRLFIPSVVLMVAIYLFFLVYLFGFRIAPIVYFFPPN